MDQMENSKGTPTKTTSTKNSNDNDFRSFDHGEDAEVESPKPSIATPSFPDEMPLR